ncbi:class I SAM-dependent methyltransferase [Mesorhizobium sp. M0898]|uniref:class I SAM-dependent methyltransferase n=1 Tax=Mesorhizobium sp. M0898 TaxID=2957020 RepID=UPI00333DD488
MRLLHKHHFQTALDVGSGTGFYSRFLENYVPQVVGVDISSQMLRIAGEKSKSTFVNADFLQYHSDVQFDFALSARTLSHIKSVSEFLRYLDINTHDGASIIITDIHPRHNYYKTRFELNTETIEIETYKHEMTEIIGEILSSFSINVMYKEFEFSNLQDKWFSSEFNSVMNSVDPVFYVIAFRKHDLFDKSVREYLTGVLKFNSATSGS